MRDNGERWLSVLPGRLWEGRGERQSVWNSDLLCPTFFSWHFLSEKNCSGKRKPLIDLTNSGIQQKCRWKGERLCLRQPIDAGPPPLTAWLSPVIWQGQAYTLLHEIKRELYCAECEFPMYLDQTVSRVFVRMSVRKKKNQLNILLHKTKIHSLTFPLGHWNQKGKST